MFFPILNLHKKIGAEPYGGENFATALFWGKKKKGHVYKSEVKSLSHVQFFETPWTVAYQAPQSMEFFRQEYWSGLLFPSPGDLLNPGIEPGSPALQADALPSKPPGKPIICI